jgi:dTDP-4-amino-4,6-dideoxygalactose transaminase
MFKSASLNLVALRSGIQDPVSQALLVGAELAYVGQAVSGGHASGEGPFTRRVEKLMQA